jgi:hypothetical protein
MGAAVHPDFGCGMAAVPDGMRWSAPQSLTAHSKCGGRSGLCQPRSHLLCHHCVNSLSNRRISPLLPCVDSLALCRWRYWNIVGAKLTLVHQ